MTSTAAKMSAAEIMAGSEAKLSKGWLLKKVRLSNDVRVEITMGGRSFLSPSMERHLTDAGVVMERIAYNNRYFVPTGKDGSTVLTQMMKNTGTNPVLIGKPESEAKESRFLDHKPVATLTGDELGAWEDIRQLGKKAESKYKSNLVGNTAINAASGMKITFTGAAAKKLSGRKGDILYRAVPALRAIIEQGIVVSTSPETKGRAHIKAWHHISAAVVIDGKPRDLIAHVFETKEGQFHYDLSRDMSDGARFLRMSAATSITENRYGLEDSPIDINLDLFQEDIKADGAVPVSAMREVTDALNRELAKSGLAGKVYPILVRRLLGDSGVEIAGRQQGRVIEINTAVQDKIGALRHEIVHALRDEALWDKPFGLFTGAEWKSLVAHARANEAMMALVAENYPNLNTLGQIEEAVAELYREWAQGRDARSEVGKIFDKIRAFFRAIAVHPRVGGEQGCRQARVS